MKKLFPLVALIGVTNMYSNALASDHQAMINAIPRIVPVVTQMRDDACNQVRNMEENARRSEEALGAGNGISSTPKFIAGLNGWKQACERRTGILNTLTNGSESEKIDTIGKISADPEVSRILNEEKNKLGSQPNYGPLDGPL